MKDIKVGDWVTFCKDTPEEFTFKVEWISADGYDVGTIEKDGPNIGCITAYTRNITLWQPKEGELCWNTYKRTLVEIRNIVEGGFELSFGCYSNSNGIQHSGYYTLDALEPFIGQLPSFLQEQP